MDVGLKISKRLFNKAYLPYVYDDTRYQIFFGGSSSGKSFFAVGQRTILDVLNGGRNYLIIRNTGSTHRGSTFNEIMKAIHRFKVRHLFKVNQSDMLITCANGYQIMFKGLDDVEKVKSVTPIKGVITDILVEEATETKREDIKQLDKRLRGESKKAKRLILLFNPILRSHWIYKEYFDGAFMDGDKEYRSPNGKLLIRKTTYVDNDFLTEDDVYALEHEKDEYFREVYTYGNWGVLGDLIFRNWRVEDLSGIKDTFDKIRIGLDFGYSNDPAACNLSHYDRKRKRIYIFDEYNATGRTNPQLADDIREMVRKDTVICDNAEPKSIQELKDCGINAAPAKKGRDSLLHGIQWLNQHEIIIDRRCQHTVNEFQVYHWEKDKNGEATTKPVDKDNHHIDGIRYAFERDFHSFAKGLDLR